MPKDVNVVACISIAHSIPAPFMGHWTRFITHAMQSFKNFAVVVTDLIYVDKARNSAIEQAFSMGFQPDYIFIVDADNLIPPDIIERLMHCDKDIVSALYFAHLPPYEPLVYKIGKNGYFDNYPYITPNRVMECHGIGMGAVLIKADVFKKIKYPWFKYWLRDENLDMISRLIKTNPEFEKEVCSKLNIKALEELPEMTDCGQLGEDLYFCKKAITAGYKIHVDCATIVPHWGAPITEKEFKPYMEGVKLVPPAAEIDIRLDMDQMGDPVIREMANIMNANPHLKKELFKRLKGGNLRPPSDIGNYERKDISERIAELEEDIKSHKLSTSRKACYGKEYAKKAEDAAEKEASKTSKKT